MTRGEDNQRHTPLQPIPLLPSSSLPIHPSPYFSASLTFNQRSLGRLNQRGGQEEAGGARKHAGARKQGQVGQEARKETRKRAREKRARKQEARQTEELRPARRRATQMSKRNGYCKQTVRGMSAE